MSAPTAPVPDTPASRASRAERIGDAALDLLVERGMRGLTHRAVDERAGLPQGSTSNHARTRQALLETAVRRQVHWEARVLTPDELPGSGGPDAPDSRHAPDRRRPRGRARPRPAPLPHGPPRAAGLPLRTGP